MHIYLYERWPNAIVMGIVYDCPVSEKRKRIFKKFECDTSAKLHYANISNEYLSHLMDAFLMGKNLDFIKKVFYGKYVGLMQRAEIILKYKEELFHSIDQKGMRHEKELQRFEELLKIARTWHNHSKNEK